MNHHFDVPVYLFPLLASAGFQDFSTALLDFAVFCNGKSRAFLWLWKATKASCLLTERDICAVFRINLTLFVVPRMDIALGEVALNV